MGWRIALWFFLVLAGLVILVISLPVGLRLRYNQEGLKLWCAIGPVRFILPSSKENKSKDDVDTRFTAKSFLSGSDKESQKNNNVLKKFWAELKTVLAIFGYLRPRLRVKRLVLRLHLAGSSPATLAMQYGSAWAAIGWLIPLLEEAFIVNKRDLDVDCDYSGVATTMDAELDISIGLGRLLLCLFRYILATPEIKNETH